MTRVSNKMAIDFLKNFEKTKTARGKPVELQGSSRASTDPEQTENQYRRKSDFK